MSFAAWEILAAFLVSIAITISVCYVSWGLEHSEIISGKIMPTGGRHAAGRAITPGARMRDEQAARQLALERSRQLTDPARWTPLDLASVSQPISAARWHEDTERLARAADWKVTEYEIAGLRARLAEEASR